VSTQLHSGSMNALIVAGARRGERFGAMARLAGSPPLDTESRQERLNRLLGEREAAMQVLKALASNREGTAADVAAAAGVGRSTASKVLARLASSREVHRTEGGRDGARRLPDRFALASAEPAAKGAKPKAAEERLKPGQLDGLVLDYLKKNAGSGPHGPTTVANALERSSGAVNNCLVRLTKSKQVRQESDKPRRYSLAPGRS
jgi:Sugar-specific transcriptional regulator TrmB